MDLNNNKCYITGGMSDAKMLRKWLSSKKLYSMINEDWNHFNILDMVTQLKML